MDNLDENNTGRVTRSLRKRMTSVDSESSNRSETPTGFKLSSISEVIKLDSPSRPIRKTRRSSVSEVLTPVKTPAKSAALKRFDTPDVTNSPMRRSTRRRSVSVSEDDQNIQTIKSINQFDTLAEEESSAAVENKSNLSSSSNTPKAIVETKTNSISIGTSEIEPKLQKVDINRRSSNTITIGEIECVSLSSSEDLEADGKMVNTQKSKEDVYDVNGSDAQNLSDANKEPLKNQIETDTSPKKLIETMEKNSQAKKEESTKETNEIISPDVTIATNNDPVTINDKASQKEKNMKPKVRLKRLPSSQELNVGIYAKKVFLTKNGSFSLKVVEFKESGNPEKSKIVYPGTPHVTKDKNLANEKSIQVLNRKLVFHDDKQVFQNYEEKTSNEDANDVKRYFFLKENPSILEVLPEKNTPYKPTLKAELRSSTPIVLPASSDSIKQNNADKKISTSLSPTSLNTSTNTNCGREITPRKEDLLVSPDKLLRSGKVYGTSPPTTTIIGTPKKRTISPASDVNSPKDNDMTSESVKKIEVDAFKPSKNMSSEKNKISSPSTNTTIGTPKNPTFSPENAGSGSLKNTPKKGTISPASNVNSPENNDATSGSVKNTESDTVKTSTNMSCDKTKISSSPTNTTNGTISPASNVYSPEDNDLTSGSVKKIEGDAVKLSTNMISEKKEISFATSWSQCVMVKVNEHSKIDVIQGSKGVFQQTTSKKDLQGAAPKAPMNSKHSRYESDDNEDRNATDMVVVDAVRRTGEEDVENEVCEDPDDEENELSEDVEGEENEFSEHVEDEENELGEDEKPYKNHPFAEDEAMEVDDDYQSGDSLNSEDRLEIEENEIHDKGESIGSEDTEGEHDIEDEDDGDDSFIAEDSEVSVLNYSDDEHMETTKSAQNGNKIYKRILTIDSSDSEEDEGNSTKPVETDGKDQALSFEVTKMIDDDSISDNQDVLELELKKPERKYSFEATVKGHDNTSNDVLSKNMRKSNDFQSSSIDSPLNKSLSEHQNKEPTVEEKEWAEILSNINKNAEHMKPLNVSKEESVAEKDTEQVHKECVVESNDSGPNVSKLSDSAKQLLESKDSAKNTDSESDLESETEQLNASRKQIIKNLNQSDHLNKTLYELNKDKLETSSEKEIRIDTESSKKSKKASLLKSNNTEDSTKTFANETEITSEACNGSFTGNTAHTSKKKSMNSRKSDEHEKLLKRSDVDKSILSNETGSDEDEEQSNVKRISSSFAKCKTKEKSQINNTKTSILQHKSSDESINENLNNGNHQGNTASDDSVSESEMSYERKAMIKKNTFSTSFESSKMVKNNLDDKEILGSPFRHNKNKEKKRSQIASDEDSSDDSNTQQNACADEVYEPYESNSKTLAEPLKIPSPRHSAENINTLSKDSLSDNSITDNSENNSAASSTEKATKHKQTVENKSNKRKRLSKSFSHAGSLDITDIGDQVHHLKKKLKICKNESANSSLPIEKSDNINQILDRCEEILEAANRAKLEAKQNYNKSKLRVVKSKHFKKSQKTMDYAEGEQIEVDQKYHKHDDDLKKVQIKQAFRAAKTLILEKTTKNPKFEYQLAHPEPIHPGQDLLELQNDAEESISTRIKNRENPQHFNVFKSSAGEILEIPVKEVKKASTKQIKLSTGTVCVEPVTPTKQSSLSGFHESPMTPRTLGFKVRKIVTAGQDKPLKMSTEFQRKKHTRNQYDINVRKHALPKPQWTQSGVFIEEDLRPIQQSGSTQFIVSGLNGAGKGKHHNSFENRATPLSVANSNALQFKQNYMLRNNVPRESSREILLRKERKRHS